MNPTGLVLAAILVAILALRWNKLTGEIRILGILAVCVLAVLGSGLVHFPDFEKLIEDIGSTLGAWTYLLVGGMAFLETAAFIGFLVPGEFTVIFGGVIAGQHQISVFILLVVVWIGAILGDTVSFFLGRKLGRNFLVRYGDRVMITRARLETVEHFYADHGRKMVLVGRFIGFLRPLGPFIAGASKMPFMRFFPFDAIGGILWGTTFVILGYIFWRSLDEILKFVGQSSLALGIVFAVVLGFVALRRYYRAKNRNPGGE